MMTCFTFKRRRENIIGMANKRVTKPTLQSAPFTKSRFFAAVRTNAFTILFYFWYLQNTQISKRFVKVATSLISKLISNKDVFIQ